MRAPQHWHKWNGDRSIDMFADPHSRREFPRAAARQVRSVRNRESGFSPLLLQLRVERKVRRILLPTDAEILMFAYSFFGIIEPEEDRLDG